MPLRPALFFDRDGTLIEDVHYLDRPEDVVLIPGATDVIRRLNQLGVPVILASNQSGVGRGYLTDQALEQIHDRLTELLAQGGCRINAAYYCRHHPDASCTCRKPSPGLLLRAAEEMSIDLARSCIVGDKGSDIEAGRRAGCRTVLVLTGKGRKTARASTSLVSDHIAADLPAAWPWLQANVLRGRSTPTEIRPIP